MRLSRHDGQRWLAAIACFRQRYSASPRHLLAACMQKALRPPSFAANGAPGTHRCRDRSPECEPPVLPALPRPWRCRYGDANEISSRRRPTNRHAIQLDTHLEHGAITDGESGVGGGLSRMAWHCSAVRGQPAACQSCVGESRVHGCSRALGTRCATTCLKDLMAVSRALRVRGALPRTRCRDSRTQAPRGRQGVQVAGQPVDAALLTGEVEQPLEGIRGGSTGRQARRPRHGKPLPQIGGQMWAIAVMGLLLLGGCARSSNRARALGWLVGTSMCPCRGRAPEKWTTPTCGAPRRRVSLGNVPAPGPQSRDADRVSAAGVRQGLAPVAGIAQRADSPIAHGIIECPAGG